MSEEKTGYPRGMTIRERYALEFAKVLLHADIRRAEIADAASVENGEDPKEYASVIEDFYITACQAAGMADALAVALKHETPGWRFMHDDSNDYTGCRAGIKEERIAECNEDVGAAVDASSRLVFPAFTEKP